MPSIFCNAMFDLTKVSGSISTLLPTACHRTKRQKKEGQCGQLAGRPGVGPSPQPAPVPRAGEALLLRAGGHQPAGHGVHGELVVSNTALLQSDVCMGDAFQTHTMRLYKYRARCESRCTFCRPRPCCHSRWAAPCCWRLVTPTFTSGTRLCSRWSESFLSAAVVRSTDVRVKESGKELAAACGTLYKSSFKALHL